MKKDRMFQIKTTVEITVTIPARNRKEAKAFAEEEMLYLINVDTNEYNNVMLNSKRETKRPKVFEIIDMDEQQPQGETNNGETN